MSKYYIYVAIVLAGIFLFEGCTPKNELTHVDSDSPLIRYTGRINYQDPKAPIIYWSGSEIEVNFSGDSLKVIFEDEKGDNYFNVVIDSDSLRYMKLDSGRHAYLLAGGLPKGSHKIEVLKRTEWEQGYTRFHGLYMVNGHLSEPQSKRGRIIEFYGNSITAGYAIEDNTGGDNPDSIYTNNYATYGAITSRHFNADYIGTVRSGIGIMISWFPVIMPEIYNRLDPTDSLSLWDFSSITPDIVVINLLQNDSWLVNLPEYPTFLQRFGTEKPEKEQIIKAYIDFVSSIRKVYPEAHIICALGSMDATKEGSVWPAYVSEAVEIMNDKKIYTHFFPFINSNGHPRVNDNQKMAESLIAFIAEKTGWE